MIDDYPPYSVAADNVAQQGDLINFCPILLPISKIEDTENTLDGEIVEYNVIILSQSCDLEPRGEEGKINLDFVLVCPVWPLSKFADEGGIYKSTKGKERLRRGIFPSFHLLHECDIEEYKRECLYVDFRQVHSVPYDAIQYCITSVGKRLRLLPPYREHLSQAFARFFMRVGLPLQITPFSKNI